jgi:hypothetical protein
MKDIAMIAHPDDCIIFTYGFMHANKYFIPDTVKELLNRL